MLKLCESKTKLRLLSKTVIPTANISLSKERYNEAYIGIGSLSLFTINICTVNQLFFRKFYFTISGVKLVCRLILAIKMQIIIKIIHQLHWFLARNICDDKALMNLTKISYV